jgi:regulator of RNase E activity RraA
MPDNAANAAINALDSEVLECLRSVSTATITMQLLKRGLRSCYIAGARPLGPETPHIAAEAYTLRFIPMREDLSEPKVLADPNYPPRRAIEDIPPGQIMVIDCRGVTTAGALGDILALRLKVRGVAGVITDGPVRDAAGVLETGLAVYCAGSAAPVSLGEHFGADVQRPIACGGVAVFPGDVVAADQDGAVVIPRALARAIAEAAPEQESLEDFLTRRIADGHPLIGTYPPNEDTLAAYEAWKAGRAAG